MSMSRRTLSSSMAKFIGTLMEGRPAGSVTRISALALNPFRSPKRRVIAAFQLGAPPERTWAWTGPGVFATARHTPAVHDANVFRFIVISSHSRFEAPQNAKMRSEEHTSE